MICNVLQKYDREAILRATACMVGCGFHSYTYENEALWSSATPHINGRHVVFSHFNLGPNAVVQQGYAHAGGEIWTYNELSLLLSIAGLFHNLNKGDTNEK